MSSGSPEAQTSQEKQSSADEERVRGAAADFLRQRGFTLSGNQPREVKINELLQRDYAKAPRYALHVGVHGAVEQHHES